MNRTEIIAHREEWIDALLSGGYPQGHDMLRTPDALFCCLGVACDVIDPRAWDTSVFLAGTWRGHEPAAFPEQMMEWAGLTEITAGRLATMNDDGASFGDIAAYIYELPIDP